MITSRSNDIVRHARSLQLKKVRDAEGLHLIEGKKLVQEAIDSGAKVTDLFVCDGLAFPSPQDVRVHTLSRDVLEAICQSDTPQGMAAIVETPGLTPPSRFPAGLIVVLERLQDPGNTGTILRTADAMGASGVLLSPDCADPFSPKTLRSAMGSTYHLPIWQGPLAPGLSSMAADGFTLICGHLHGTVAFPDPGDRCAIVIGNEGSGVSEETAALCQLVRLPMYGRAESLNASVAAGILLYETANRMFK